MTKPKFTSRTQTGVRKLLQYFPDSVSMNEFENILKRYTKNVKVEHLSTLYNKYCEFIQHYADDVFPTTIGIIFGWSGKSSNTIDYYIERGWTKEDAEIALINRQRTNSIQYIMNKHNVSEAEASEIVSYRAAKGTLTAISNAGSRERYKQKKRDTLQKMQESKALSAGMSVEEYRKEHNCKNLLNYRKQVETGERNRAKTNTSLEYYLGKGLSVAEATIARSARQRTFSLSKCIEKHGETIGRSIFSERQRKWQNTLNSKSEAEKWDILSRKIANGAFVSTASETFFNAVEDQVDLTNYTIYRGQAEYYINDDGKFWKYDFTIKELKLIVEYNGTHVHPKPDSLSDWKHVFTKETKNECMKKENAKRLAAEKRGFKVEYVWSDDSHNDSVTKIVEVINQLQKDTK